MKAPIVQTTTMAADDQLLLGRWTKPLRPDSQREPDLIIVHPNGLVHPYMWVKEPSSSVKAIVETHTMRLA